MKFVDEVRISLKSGCGGAGCVSFSRSPLKPRGGPDGGDGGCGGHVIFRVNSHLNTLFHLQGKRQLSAKNGQQGSSQNRKGAGGSDLIIEVPVGTGIYDTSNHREVVDLTSGEYRLLTGGRGGKGNSYYKSSTNQTPEQFQSGESGQEMEVTLKLKLMADIGVIGFPNAGKSTLVSVLTGAKTKIGDYPFTTLEPRLGVFKRGESSLTLADIPGLIPGASRGTGLGIQFLRHIERTRAFVHLLDVSTFSDRDVWDDYAKINDELKAYDIRCKSLKNYIPLTHRPQTVVFNKMDIAEKNRVEHFEKIFKDQGIRIIKISATTKEHREELMDTLLEQLKKTQGREFRTGEKDG